MPQITAITPNPPTGRFIATVRTSCASASQKSGLIPNLPNIDTFIRSLDRSTFEKLKLQHGLQFPLKFPNLHSEINFLGVLALLNGLSGYRTAFHAATGSGVYQNIVRLLFGLYITGSADSSDSSSGSSFLSAQGLRTLEAGRVAELLGVSLHEEKPHETIPGLTVGLRGGEISDAVELIVKVCNETGQRLIDAGYPNLGAWALETLKATSGKDDLEASEYFIEKLVTFLPAFADQFTVDINGQSENVYVYKRAFFFLHSLYARLKDHPESGLSVPNTLKTLPMFVDNVLPTMTVWFGLIDASAAKSQAQGDLKSLSEWIDNATQYKDLPREKLEQMNKNQPGPLLNENQGYIVRAVTLEIGKVIVERAQDLAKQSERGLEWLKDLNEVDLDGYLWAVAKDDELLRKVPRFMQKQTMMF